MRRLKLAFVAIVLLAMALQIPPTWAQEETITFMWCPPETGSLPATYDLVACTDTTNVIATAIASAWRSAVCQATLAAAVNAAVVMQRWQCGSGNAAVVMQQW